MSNGTQTDFTVDEKFMPATEDASTELFEGIDEVYFLEIGFKAVNHELEKLSDTLFETEDLQKEIFKLKKQMQLVSRKITSFVAKNSLEFNKNVENLDVIQNEAEALLNLIKQLRRLVNYCRKKCQASSIVLAIEFKRQKMFKIKEEIVNIQKLYKTEFRLKELIEEGSIFTFVQLALETIIEINKYIEYSSIKQLSANVLAVLKKEILKIDKLLEEQVCSFQLKYYFYIYSVYELIGNLETSLALICMDSMENNQSMDDQINYLELCKFVNQKSFTRALIEVGNSLVNILGNYHLILKFHIEEDKKKSISNENDSEISECFDAQIIDKGVLQKSMLDNLFQIFDYSATFYNDLLSSMDLEHLKIDQFIRIMEISERFRLFGQRHFGNSCSLIALTLENKSKSFFAHYHLERIDEIHMFLESETFTLCPVSVQFTLFDLPVSLFIH
uniref:Vacuolar protein sorting-associated protein 54 N-terminal domain-containing protein n=1 Tax=Meloidogyne incognita TaxID=6306 RepID=A0A914L897_MELIC